MTNATNFSTAVSPGRAEYRPAEQVISRISIVTSSQAVPQRLVPATLKDCIKLRYSPKPVAPPAKSTTTS